MTGSPRPIVDSDVLAIRRASRLVGTRVALACAAVVVVIIVAVFVYILSEISPRELFEPVPDTDNLQVSAVKLLRAAAVLGIALVVLAGLLSWWVTRRAVQPLADVLRIQRAFIADASHELRTPLAVLDARLQILQRALPAHDPSSPVVAELRRDTADLVHIVNDLLESAEIGGAAVTPVSGTDVSAAIEAACRSMALIAVTKRVSIVFSPAPSALAPVPASSVTRCIVALLDNAVRFAPPGSLVTVELTLAARSMAVSVRDCGPGIVGIDPARIFDRFAHSVGAASGGTEARTGFGIGLSLVRDIAVRYGGTVAVIESSPAGTAISLSLPRTRST